MKISDNPFKYRTQVINDVDYLWCRDKQLNLIKKRVLDAGLNSNLAIIGARGVGKSSLINTVLQTNRNNPDVMICNLSASSYDNGLSLFKGIANSLSAKIRRLELPQYIAGICQDIKSDINWHDVNDHLIELLKALKDEGINVILVLDDFDKTEQLFKQSSHYFLALRELAYKPECRVSLIVLSRKDIMSIEVQSCGNSNLAGIFEDVITLKPFSEAEQTIYFDLLAERNINLESNCRTLIQDYCGGLPKLLNCLLYEIIELKSDSEINIDQLLTEKGHVFIATIDSLYLDLSKEGLLDTLVENVNKTAANAPIGSKLRMLDSLGIMKKTEGEWQCFSTYFIDHVFNTEGLGEIELFKQDYRQLELNLMTLINTLTIVEPAPNASESIDSTVTLAQLDDKLRSLPHTKSQLPLHLQLSETDFENGLRCFIESHQRLESEGNVAYTGHEHTSIADTLRKNAQLLIDNIESLLIKECVSFGGPKCLTSLIEINLIHFKGWKNVSLKFTKHCQWIFITGENGYGKTALLQGIATTLNKGKIEHTLDDDFNCAYVVNHQARQHLFNYKNPLSSLHTFTHFLAYGSSRLIQTSQMGVENDSTQISSLFDEQSAFLSIETFLLEQQKLFSESKESKEKAQYEKRIIRTKEALLRLLENFYNDIDVEGTKIQYISKSSDKVLFQDLSAGHRSLIGMVGDMIVRILALQPDIECFSDFSGIILIDEIDVHLHPKLQKGLPKILSETFPHVQFIVSTHSPIPILGAPKDSAFLKVSCNDMGEFEVSDCKESLGDVEYTNPNVLFSSPVFDLENFFHCDSDDAEKNDVADSYQESQFDKDLKSKDADENEKFNQILNGQ